MRPKRSDAFRSWKPKPHIPHGLGDIFALFQGPEMVDIRIPQFRQPPTTFEVIPTQRTDTKSDDSFFLGGIELHALLPKSRKSGHGSMFLESLVVSETVVLASLHQKK